VVYPNEENTNYSFLALPAIMLPYLVVAAAFVNHQRKTVVPMFFKLIWAGKSNEFNK